MPFDRDLRTLIKSLETESLPPTESIKRRQARADAQFETDVEWTERHVREGEARVARQREIVFELRAEGRDSELAESLLAQFEDILAARKLRLARLKR